MSRSALPAPAQLRAVLDYDPATGALRWKHKDASMFAVRANQSAEQSAKAWNGRYAGKPAFTATHCNGYLIGTTHGLRIFAHRVAWAIHYGEWPPQMVDHINGDRKDNRITNLRSVNSAENHRNVGRRSDNRSGIVGVRQEQSGRWAAEIRVNGRSRRLGTFETREEAAAARLAAAAAHNFHPNHGAAR